MFVQDLWKQSLPLLLMCGIGCVFAGLTLSSMMGIFEAVPGLLVAVPAIIALRGNISTAFGSRLGSAYHLGVIDSENMWNREIRENIIGSLLLSVVVSALVGILAVIISEFVFAVHVDAVLIILIVLFAGVASALILTLLTIGIIYLVFRRGLDPDNITGPALATFGDIVTMLCIYASAVLMVVSW